jgi:hypothetical protein
VADARAVGREGEEKIFVDVRRRYLQADEDTNEKIGEDVITERRTLVFMRDPVPTPASATGAPPRIIKRTYPYIHSPSPELTLPSSPQRARLQRHPHPLRHSPLQLLCTDIQRTRHPP